MAQTGDRAAEETILRQYTPYVLKQIQRRFPTHRPVSDDSLQEGMIGLLEAVRTFNPAKGMSFYHWSGRRIYWRVLEHLLNETEYASRFADEGRPEGKYNTAEHVSPPALLNILDDRERRIVEMRYGFTGPEMTLAQIGESLGISKQRVYQIHQAALSKMRLTSPHHPSGD